VRQKYLIIVLSACQIPNSQLRTEKLRAWGTHGLGASLPVVFYVICRPCVPWIKARALLQLGIFYFHWEGGCNRDANPTCIFARWLENAGKRQTAKGKVQAQTISVL
jgi:hypothetical protein